MIPDADYADLLAFVAAVDAIEKAKPEAQTARVYVWDPDDWARRIEPSAAACVDATPTPVTGWDADGTPVEE